MSHGPKHLVERICPTCGTHFEVYPSSRKISCSFKCRPNNDHFTAWRELNSDYQNGEKNPAWKGGTSRATILRRVKKVLEDANVDQYTCQVCGRKSGVRMNIHHKDGDRLNNKPENLEVLCPVCHNSGSPNAKHTRLIDELGRFKSGITICDSETSTG